VVRDGRAPADRDGYQVLFADGGFALAIVEDAAALAREIDVRLIPADESRVLYARSAAPNAPPDPIVEQVLAALDQQSYTDYLKGLSVDLPTRWSCASEMVDARAFVNQALTAVGLAPTEQPFTNWCSACDQAEGYNIIAIKEGSVRPDDWYLVGAHMDSASPNGCARAPGSNDNGSGTAGVLELARVFAELDTEATILFVAFSGEEQGLIGSDKLGRVLVQNGWDQQLKGFVIMDMISFYQDNYTVSIEGSTASEVQRQAFEDVVVAAQTYTDLGVTYTNYYWGSDHAPLLERGMPGVMYIEFDFDLYSYYHTQNDTFEHQDMPYAMEMLKIAAASLATWAVVLPETDDDDDTSPDDDDDDDDNDNDDNDNDDAADDDAATDDDDDDSGGCGC
jgi:hypothetical protein